LLVLLILYQNNTPVKKLTQYITQILLYFIRYNRMRNLDEKIEVYREKIEGSKREDEEVRGSSEK